MAARPKYAKRRDNPKDTKVTARILFNGLMLMCINKENRCEVGIVQCPGHEPKMRVKTLRDGVETASFSTTITGDLYVCAVNAASSGVTRHESFRLHPDLENKSDSAGTGPFHGRVTVNTSVLSARVSVDSGELYTHETTGDEYDVVEWVKPTDEGKKVARFGLLAKTTGLNISCKDGKDSGIAIFDRVVNFDYISSEKIWLPAQPGTRYDISIDNDCYLIPPPKDDTNPHADQSYRRTDFRLYYTSRLITTVDGKKDGRPISRKFDLRQVTQRSPEVCERVFLGKTKTLGLPIAGYGELNEHVELARREREHGKGRR